ncbi:MAG: SMI1/KNR4 family protein [Planctomycetaceae bacterium]
MSMANLEQALQLIAENEAEAEFVGPRDEHLIELAEEALGFSFPPTFRRFLKEKGCGSIAGLEVYGLISNNFSNSSVPNGIWLTLDERKSSMLPETLILISDAGEGGYYAIDRRQQDSRGESPVIIWVPGESTVGGQVEQIAADFGSFLLQQLNQQLK